MTRKHLQWSDIRPTLLRAVGRSGVEYRIEETESGRWALYRFPAPADPGTLVTIGWKLDMKDLAEAEEADALPPAPPQRIAWSRIRAGHYWGVAPCGLAYRILKVGKVSGETLYRLDRFPNADAEHDDTREFLDEGALVALKRCAVEDATAAARELAQMEVA